VSADGVPGPVLRIRRRLSALSLVMARLPGLNPLLRTLGIYPPAARVVPGTERVVESYGPDRMQVGEWWVPPASGAGSGPRLLPTVVLVHGGYWRAGYDRTLENAVAADLAGRGFLCWVPDYRPSTYPWPTTLADAAAAADHLTRGRFADRVDPGRLAFVGHSAGGHLALWLGSRHRIPSGAGVASGLASGTATLRPTLVVSQAGVAALTKAARDHLGGGASAELVGGLPAAVDERYAVADPLRLLPTGVPTVLIHGVADPTVPLDQSTTYRDAARAAGDHCELVEVPGGHMEHLDPSSPAVEALRTALCETRGR
jgi:acetyl esterase/lipase